MIIALSKNGIVISVQPSAFPTLPPSEQFHADLNPVDVTNVSPQPEVGWSATESGGAWTFAPPPPPVPPTPAQQAKAAYDAFIAGGLAITSTSTPAINGTYALDPGSQQTVTTEAAYINAFSEFTTGAASNFPWRLPNGSAIVFPTTASFMAVTKAIAQSVTAANLALQSESTTMPPSSVTIP